jgi:hypothetical protein
MKELKKNATRLGHFAGVASQLEPAGTCLVHLPIFIFYIYLPTAIGLMPGGSVYI